MSDERKPDLPTNPTPPVVQSPNFRIIYANGFSYKPGVADFGLSAAVQVPITQNVAGNLIATDVLLQEIMIMLSLPAVKALGMNLTKLVEVIEKEVGDIRLVRGSLLSDEQLRAISDNLAENLA
jgi:hypothetical protein